MFKTTVLLCLFRVSLCKNVEVTFKDVTFHGYNINVHKFEKTIQFSNSLHENIPEGQTYDKIEFKDQNIQILYENSISNLEDLDELIIERCGLREIKPRSFQKLPNLRRLSLKENKLTKIASDVFNSLPIYDLDLSKNEIKQIASNAFDDIPNLLHVRLSDNLIDRWNAKWFKNTPSLIRISMQNNSVETLPKDAFKNLGGVKEFQINLIFSYNKLKDIEEGAFDGLEDVKSLWLDNNLLEDFEASILENIDLKELRINSNNIKCFSGDLGKILKAEKNYVDANPFDCDCLATIEEWAKNNKKDVDLFFSRLSCSANKIKKQMTQLEKRLKDLEELDKVGTSREEVEWVLPKKKADKYTNFAL